MLETFFKFWMLASSNEDYKSQAEFKRFINYSLITVALMYLLCIIIFYCSWRRRIFQRVDGNEKFFDEPVLRVLKNFNSDVRKLSNDSRVLQIALWKFILSPGNFLYVDRFHCVNRDGELYRSGTSGELNCRIF